MMYFFFLQKVVLFEICSTYEAISQQQVHKIYLIRIINILKLSCQFLFYEK